MDDSEPGRRDVLIATSGFLTLAGCTNSAAVESGYGTAYGDTYGSE
ncbi:hypothetical protein BDK88_0942 [Natrinema hispanicum]|uniref:Uncharacterized protein n=1 Tax=Natrinema hispanicum TaxID=392421 RepID=A0A482YJF5_9EURY|nr:hypothetical protein [Natrinema hispanicum]RZV12052.1 hypothetical protein BDK88_0942 [Natrinema hispanicum]